MTDIPDEDADGIAAVVAGFDVSACDTENGQAVVIELVTIEGSWPVLLFPDQARDLIVDLADKLILLEENLP